MMLQTHCIGTVSLWDHILGGFGPESCHGRTLRGKLYLFGLHVFVMLQVHCMGTCLLGDHVLGELYGFGPESCHRITLRGKYNNNMDLASLCL